MIYETDTLVTASSVMCTKAFSRLAKSLSVSDRQHSVGVTYSTGYSTQSLLYTTSMYIITELTLTAH